MDSSANANPLQHQIISWCLIWLLLATSGPVQALALAERHRYDEMDRLVATWDAEHPSATNPIPTSRTVYDDNGKVWKSYDALGNYTEQLYNDRGLLARTNYADGTNEQTTYDADGRRQYATDRRGRNTQFVYDSTKTKGQTL